VSNYRLLSSTIVLYFECRYDLQIVRVDVERLKELRVERALSLRELGAASGLSHNTIWKLERGREEAHPRTIRKLAEALGVTPRDLMAKGDGDA
jgi:transcriptional regulator with XRE-family HTH domain